MQTKFYFLLASLVGFSSVSSNLVAQTACYDYGAQPENHPGFELSVEELAAFGADANGALSGLAGMTTYRIYLNTPDAADYVSAVMSGGQGGTVSLSTTGSFFHHQYGGTTPNLINPALFGFFPALEFDSWVTIGLEGQPGLGEDGISLQAQAAWANAFNSGSSFSVGGNINGGWFINSGSNGLAGADNRVLLAQLTTDGEIGGALNISVETAGGQSFTHQFTFSTELCGCTDPESPSFNADATYNDGSCVYMGCTDETACNFDTGATDNDGSCDYCCNATTSDAAGYGVDVELHAVGGVVGMRTYRLYATTANSTDALSAVAGLAAAPLEIATTTSFHQDPFGGSTPQNLNPLFFSAFPEMEFDSFVSIGLSQTAVDGQNATQIAKTPGEDWEADFEAGGNINISTVTGGAWFVQPGGSNAIAGDDNRVLIGQFTTDGFLSGSVLIQVFPNGDQTAEIQYNATFSTPTCACTDESACNYDVNALWDDGTCQYPIDVFGIDYIDCDENCLNDSDGDYVCDEDEIVGCIVAGACNYVAGATDIVPCQWPQNGYDCSGTCLVDTDGDGVCDMYEIVDCTDETACNFNSASTTNSDNSLCWYAEAGYDCDGVCLADADGDGVCDEFEVAGCDEEDACNYDTAATENDGSCDYCCFSDINVNGYSVTIEETATSVYGTTYRMYVNTDDATDVVSAITGSAEVPTTIETTASFWQAPGFNTLFPTSFLPTMFALLPDLAFDSWITLGVDQAPMPGTGLGPISIAATTTAWQDNFIQNGADIVLNSTLGDGWFVTTDYANGVAGDDHRVLVGQFTTTGLLSGQLYVQIFDEGNQTIDQRIVLPFHYMTEDTEAPTFTYVPEDAELSCDDEIPSDMATAEDGGCGLPVVVTSADEVIDGEGSFTIVRTFTATDAAGNTASATQTMSFIDSEPPVAVAPADITIECSQGLDPSVTGVPSESTDNCTDNLTWTYTDAPLAVSASIDGVTLDLSSEFGLNLSGLFGQPYVVAAEGVTVGAGLELTADDAVSNPVSHRGMFEVDIEGTTITLTVAGTVTGTYQYDYAHLTISNAIGYDFGALDVISSNIAPGAALTAMASGDDLIIFYDGTAVYSEGQTATFELANQSTCLATAGVVRTWTVSDDAGYSDTAQQTILVVDTEGPVFADFPADNTVSCADDTSVDMPSASDCSGTANVSVEESIVAGDCDNSYTIIRTYTAVDGCNNSTVQTHTMTVVDDEAPVLSDIPADVTIQAGDALPSELPEATDNCATPTITFADASAVGELATVITRTFTATDACGNSASAVQVITVNEILGCDDPIACNFDGTATYNDGSCDYCSCGSTSGGQNGFGLELELHAENAIPGLNTYRLYVTTPTAEDFVSAVAGDSNVATYLNTSTSFHQEQFGSHDATSINPLFFGYVPSLQYDSWLTIGMESAPAAGANQDVTFVNAPGDYWWTVFEGGGNLDISSFFGGSWFTLPTQTNGYAGDDQRVLVAQLTTDGEVSGQMYVQVFPNGVGADAEYLTLTFGTNGCGCTDEAACNYDDSAIYSNDDECVYPLDVYGSPFVDCAGDCLNDADGDGVCDEEEIAGCDDDTACNYDLNATDNDGSCFFTEDCSGCTDASACNYAPNATTDDGSCTFAEFGLDCSGNCLDQNNDLICDALQGCNDATACNYDADAVSPSQDFCDYCSCPILFTSDNDYGIEIEEVAVDGIPGMTTYRVYVTTPSAEDRLNAVLGNDINPIVVASSSQFFQDSYGSEFWSNPSLFAVFPTLEFDSWLTIGEGTPISSLQVPFQTGGSTPAWVSSFEDGNDIVIDDAVGSGWYLSAETSDAYGVAGEDHRILVAQLTTPGTLNIQLYAQIFPNGLSAGNTKYVSMSWGSPFCACTDESACNYDAGAITDDGNCFYVTNEASCDDVCLFDNEVPVIESVENYTTNCAIASNYVFPVATDNCDSELSYDYSDEIIDGNCPNNYTIIRTWTVTDNVGYSATAVQTITVVDEVGPTFSVPADASVACGSDLNDLSLTGDVTNLMDACGSASISYSDAFAGSNCFANDIVVRTWTAVDECGNTTSATQTINIVDEVAPVFTSVPADVAISCGGNVPTDMATAEDACSGVTVTVTETAGEVGCSGMAAVIRTFTATDGCGNAAQAVQTVTYADMEAPTFTAPADASIECGSDSSVELLGEPTNLNDNCVSELTVSHVDIIETSENGCFADDAIRRTWTVTDGCGNSAVAVQMIQFVDNTAPEMDAVEASIELNCGEALPTALPGATDSCSDVTVSYTDEDADNVSCTGVANILRTFTATDACGNSTSATQLLVFVDDIAPTFTAPADVTLECGTDLSDLTLAGDVTDAADVCSADIALSYEDAVSTSEGSCMDNNIITRTWTATDGCGNSSQDVQVITLIDTTAPEVVGSDEIALVYYSDQPLPQLVELEVIEDCSDYTVETVDTYAASGVYGFELSRVYTITDACGNSTTFNQHVVATFHSGCTYPDAVNYLASALVDDGSCIYEGCTDMGAANYNPVASQDDGSCVLVGCMDPDGLDYNPDANYPGGCDYPDPCPGDLDDNGQVNVNDLLEFFQYYGTFCE